MRCLVPPLRPLAVPLLLAAACGVAGCTQHLKVASLSPAIIQGVADQVGLTLARVTCPTEPRPLKANDTFTCIGDVKGGGTLTIAVTQTDGTGNVSWTVADTVGLLDLTKVEASIVAGLKTQARVDARVDCGGKWKVAGTGDRFDCQATATDGTPIPIGVIVADEDGNVSWATK